MDNNEGQVYNMSCKKKGLLLILGIENFRDHPEMKRQGNQYDVTALEKTFKKLNFEVRSYLDLKSIEMGKAIDTAVNEETFKGERVFQCPLKDAGCFVVAIMTHGAENGRLEGAEGSTSIRELTEPLKGHLFGKPKIFFIQACRGVKQDRGLVGQIDGNDDQERIYHLPIEADLLYAYSSAEDHVAFRNGRIGSRFIQTLCECFDEYPTEEVVRILTRVNRKVAVEFGSETQTKQMPSIVSQLTKELYFKSSWPARPFLVIAGGVLAAVLYRVAIYIQQ